MKRLNRLGMLDGLNGLDRLKIEHWQPLER